jgi:hypothetical protein
MQLQGEPNFIDPSGHCVRLVFMSNSGAELCEEKEYFFGDKSLDYAKEYMENCLDHERLDDLSEGQYKLTLHEAHSNTFGESYDSNPIERVIFRIRKKTSVEVIES